VAEQPALPAVPASPYNPLVHAEVEELRPKLKEILYDCAVEIRATKAALFIFDGTSRYELVTEYGFRGAIRDVADENDPIVDRCGRGRSAFYVNGVGVEPRFSQLLFDSSTDRLLVAPLYGRGKLIGFVDMRDKAAKQAFEDPDLSKAQAIAERLSAVFDGKNIFGHRFISLANVGTPEPETQTKRARVPTAAGNTPAPAPAAVGVPEGWPPVAAVPEGWPSVGELTRTPPSPPPPPARTAQEAPVQPAPPAPPPVVAAPIRTVAPDAPPAAPARLHTRAYVPRIANTVLEATSAAARILATPQTSELSETELVVARETLRAILHLPGAVAATFSAFGHLGGVQEIASRSTLSDEAKNLLQSKLNVWLSKRGEAGGFLRTTVATPFGTSAAAVQPSDLQKVFTAPLSVNSLRGLYLTVVFSGNPERSTHELLGALHTHLQLAIEGSIHRTRVQAVQASLAEKLVEPDFAKYPELRRHSELVARLCESFAQHLGLTPVEVETARIAAIVHDCGMRLLEYDLLYRKPDLSTDELMFLREHAVVGAAMVEPLLGTEIARVVLCHHERVDGRGYPNGLKGEEIPLLARILQICDAWVAMTDLDSYQTPEGHEEAVLGLTRAAGDQFDRAVTTRFLEMLRVVR
jgi:hypothetical protein